MEKREFIEGELIGKLTFIQEDFSEKQLTGRQRFRKAVFMCTCGQKFITRINCVLDGRVNSCGCSRNKKLLSRIKRHGMSYSKEYRIWSYMKSRCYNKNNIFYQNYGGRGITVCDRWKNSFENFYSDMGKCPNGHSIDRIDNDNGYFPENCKWSTRSEQDRNKTNSVFITYKGETKILSDWAKLFHITTQKIRYNMKKGKPFEKIFNT